MSTLFQLVMPGLGPGIHVLPFADIQTWMAGTSPAMTTTVLRHHPNHSGLRGSSTVLILSSLMVPLPIRSLRSPSVAPDTLAR